MKWMWVMLICAGAAAQQTDPFAAPLEATGVSKEHTNLAAGRWRGGGPRSLPAFDKLWGDWRQLDPYATDSGKKLIAANTSIASLIRESARHLGIEPAATDAGTSSELMDEKQLAKAPAPVAKMARAILAAVPVALTKRTEALSKVEGDAFTVAQNIAVNMSADDASQQLMNTFDTAKMIDGALILAAALDATQQPATNAQPFSIEWETPHGIVALRGGGDDTYDDRDYLLIIDTGGDDTYAHAGGTRSATNPVSICIDLGGNDTYKSKEHSLGAGINGYGFLVDLAGNDTYTADVTSAGAASFGVGVLIDHAGDDQYHVPRFGQGAAAYGVGILCDRAGNDKYHTLHAAQGIGMVQGCGVLLDVAGNDSYVADDENITRPSAQTKAHNNSFAQGAGLGRRGHYPGGDGRSNAGGVGILVDGAGNDRYFGGVFCQGVSYWYALGLLVDFGGDDQYRGVWYTQGSAVHYAVSALCDLDGNDKYEAVMYQAQGAGYDSSAGILHDKAGNDQYTAKSDSQAWGNWNGIGVLWDEAGDDIYKCGGSSQGRAGSGSAGHITLSLLFDEGGTNTFPADSPAKPNSHWYAKRGDHHHGVGMAR